VALRSRLLGLPFGDQGLLIPARFYRRLGGYQALPRMEDVDLVRRIGRSRLVMLRARAVKSASYVDTRGALHERLRHLGLICLHALRVPVPLMTWLHG